MGKSQFLKSFGLALFLAIVINIFIANITYVKGSSMNPTLKEGDRLLLKKYKSLLKLEEYNRGDIVVFESPLRDDETLYIKRIIGVSGDKINIIGGQIYLNNRILKESYIKDGTFTEALFYGRDFIVPEGEVFVVGDNRFPGESSDSRLFGSIEIETIKGKISFRISPFDKMEKNL